MAAPSKRAGAAEHRLLAAVMRCAAEDILPACRIEAPAGEGARGFVDVVFAVTAFPEGEELHHLAREVLVRLAVAAAAVSRYTSIAGSRDGGSSSPKLPRAWRRSSTFCRYMSGPERTFCRLGEVVVPEERHALEERRGRARHLGEPPALQLEAALDLLAHEELALVRVHRAYAPRIGPFADPGRRRCHRGAVPLREQPLNRVAP